MPNISRAFADQKRAALFAHTYAPITKLADHKLPWQRIQAGEMPPLMFQLRLHTGERISYLYGDLHEIRYRDAGCIKLGIYGMTKLLITLEGRHLRELSELLASGLITWIEETSERYDLEEEESPLVTAITIEPYER